MVSISELDSKLAAVQTHKKDGEMEAKIKLEEIKKTSF